MRNRLLLAAAVALSSLLWVRNTHEPEKTRSDVSIQSGAKPAAPAQLASQTAPKAKTIVSSDPLHDFTEWTQDYLATRNPDLISKGVKLAKERREPFKALIKEDPREAIRTAVPMVVRQKLPPEIVSLLEKRINDIGAIRVFQGVPLNIETDPLVPTTREVELKSGGTYRAYMYGERANKLTWTPGAFVNGVAMDSELAISDEPTRRLEVGELLPQGKAVVGDCPVSGKYVIAPEDVPTVVPETLAAVETPVEIITFCDGSHIAIQNQTILYGEGVTGGSMAFSGILPSSPTPSLGQIKVLVMNVTYADQNVPPSTDAQLYATLRDVADHYSKASYGRLSLVGVVTPPIKLPHNEAWYINRDTSNGGDIGGTGISHADARNEARKLEFRLERL